MIRHLKYEQIDKQLWDRCISNADNGLIYAHSFYLDEMAKNWEALVHGNYEAVFPLTWKRKFFIHYLYQPFFCASLGLFGNNLSPELLRQFLQVIPRKYRYWDFYMNYANAFSVPGIPTYNRMNYVLSLNDSYENLYANFRENVKRNIRKSEQLQCTLKTNVDVEEVIELAKEQSKRFSPIASSDYEHFRKLYFHLYELKRAVAYGIETRDGELVSSAVFFFDDRRAYYILVGNHPNSKAMGASHALINGFIKNHSNKDLLLDFEGSDIRNLAFFYSSFGGKEELYAGIKVNRLPKLLKHFVS